MHGGRLLAAKQVHAFHQIVLVCVMVVIHHAAFAREPARMIVEEGLVRVLPLPIENDASVHFGDESVTQMEALFLEELFFESRSFVNLKLGNGRCVARIAVHH